MASLINQAFEHISDTINVADEPYFFGRITRDEASIVLNNNGCIDGLFLLRELMDSAGSYAISACYGKKVTHFKIERQDDGSVRINSGEKFIGPIELIRYYQMNREFPNIKFSIPCERPKGTKPVYYLFVKDAEFNKLVDDEISAIFSKINLSSEIVPLEYKSELESSKNRWRFKYERIVGRKLHETQSWFIKDITKEQAEDMLIKSGLLNGKFLVRTNGKHFSVETVVIDLYRLCLCYENKIKQYVIKCERKKGNKLSFRINGDKEFESIIQLVDYYHRCQDVLVDKLRYPYIHIPTWIMEKFGLVNEEKLYESNRNYNAILANNDDRISINSKENEDEPINNFSTDISNIPDAKKDVFENENDYEVPTTSEIIIHIQDLTIFDQLGSGNFGTVHRGTFMLKNKRMEVEQEIPVAIKQLKVNSDEAQKEIYEEAETMRSLSNEHIIKFIGMCYDQKAEKLMIVLELAKLGPLNLYLKRVNREQMTIEKIIKICYQVACAMEYIASKNMVHRDLAARNVLLASEDNAKVSDFGMSKKVNENCNYIAEKPGKWPIKWYPPEAIRTGKFDEKTDVWSFGVTCWEATSYGAPPHKGIDLKLLLLKLESGHRLERPELCPPEIFNIMFKCWHQHSLLRPTFTNIANEFRTAIKELYNQDV